MTLEQIAQAIAHAEGFYVEGSFPQRNHNPGDLVSPPTHPGQVGVEAGKAVFGNDRAGWMALEHQLRLIAMGMSHFYNVGMTLEQLAHVWTGGDHALNWAQNAAIRLGVSPAWTFKQILERQVERV